MADFSIIKKIQVFFETVVSTPFFIAFALAGVLLIVLMIIDIVKHKKVSRILFLSTIILVAIFIFIVYFNVVINFLDIVVESLVQLMYFPSLTMYVLMLFASNLTFLRFFLSKHTMKRYVVVSGICNLLIDLLFVFIIGIISVNKIEISVSMDLYSNDTLLTLLQISMALFASMYLLLFLCYAYKKFRQRDKNIIFDDEYPEMQKLETESSIKKGIGTAKDKVIKILSLGSEEDE